MWLIYDFLGSNFRFLQWWIEATPTTEAISVHHWHQHWWHLNRTWRPRKPNNTYTSRCLALPSPPSAPAPTGILLVNLRLASSFSVVPLSSSTCRLYSWVESRPATVALPRVVVSISSGCGTSAQTHSCTSHTPAFLKGKVAAVASSCESML